MSFDGFLSTIESDRLREVAETWRQAGTGRRMPGWRDIDPLALGKNLPIVWAWKYDRATEQFTGRLSGEEITQAFGKSLRGRKHEEFFPKDEQPRVFRLHRRVVAEPAFARGTGRVFSHVGRVGIGERIIMPLADDGANGDGIIGATVYQLYDKPAPEDPADPGLRLSFFPLD
ncbi:MAG: PAS domain-containing protein [Rhodospirillales bacterium]|nr:PAS domain-containing protein [Rhodospirillales bacterium]